MCGIAGIASFSTDRLEEKTISRMTDVLSHRGPDDKGIYLSGLQNPNASLKVGLGHRRLSIIDLETGHQPMANEDKSIWIVYNGEIYNFLELKQDLIKKGHRFNTKSDTEVIIHLYQEYGTDCLNYLRGMFALCIWDVRLNRLFLARDRVGQKPLFYFYKDGIFLFASEIKAILEHDHVKRVLDLESMDGYLTYGYAPAPCTMFKWIKKIPPAHYAIYDGRDLKIERYWKLSYKKNSLCLAECEERLYEILSDATRMQLISDVPLGAFLSGGVDSSSVVALMSGLSPGKVKTFSIGFEESDFDELKYARFIAKRFNTDHKELVVKPNALEVLPKLAWHYDQPFGDSSSIPTYYVAKMTREFVTVALNGDGGDESFAGYARYRGIKLAQYFKRCPKAFLKAGYRISRSSEYGRRFFKALMGNRDLEGAYINWLNYFTDGDKKDLYTGNTEALLKDNRADDYFREVLGDSDAPGLIERIINADVRSYLPEDLLVKVDIATMANSLEGRSPFLDHKVMEFAASLPLEYKLKGFCSKYILKRAFKKDIPLSFLNRKKKGFGVPVGEWFRKELKGFVRDMLLSKASLRKGLFSKDYIERILTEHEKRGADHTQRIFALLSFELWHRTFIDKRA